MTRADGDKNPQSGSTEEDIPVEPEQGEGAKQGRAPRTRKQVSAVELEQRFDQWRTKRRDEREERSDEESARLVRRRACVVMGAVLAAAAVTSGLMTQTTNQTIDSNQQQITALQDEIDRTATLMEKSDNDLDLEQRMLDLSAAAARDGKSVATLQQHFAELHEAADQQEGPGNGAPNEAMLAVAEHRKELADLFDPESFVVTDEEAYQWTSLPPFENGKIDPRFEWYTRYDGPAVSPASAYTWRVEVVMPDLDSSDELGLTDQAEVVWLCEDEESGEVLAWASATYDYSARNDTGVFDDLELTVTAAGAEHRPVGQSEAPEVPETTGEDE